MDEMRVVLRVLLVAWIAGGLSGTCGCRTTGESAPGGGAVPPAGAAKIFSLDELTVAVTEARAQGKKEGLGLGRLELEPATKEAFGRGVRKGDEDALKRMADQARQQTELEQQRLAEAATGFVTRTSMAMLLNAGSLRADKAATMQAWQVLDLVTARLTDLGYKVRIMVPSDKMALVRQYESARVYLAVSERFRARFVENFERMSVHDAIGMLYRLYGFSVWVGEVEPIVWLGYFNAGPTPIRNMALDIKFDEDRFDQRSGGR